MTPFTDEDLTRLKAEMILNQAEGSPLAAELVGLIARLEAAEEVCRQVEEGQKVGTWIFEGAIEAWRKEAGK